MANLSLRSWRGSLPLPEVAHIVHEVCAAMTAAHAAGVVHRDLKPDNVLIGKDGRVVVTDFGIARAAAGANEVARTMGGIVGTPAYMAPEQVDGRGEIDARADVYALGAMVYELLTGERAWPGDAPLPVATARLLRPPPDPRSILPKLASGVALVVMRCMAKSREDRFANAEDVSQALRDAVASSASLAPSPSTPSLPLRAPEMDVASGKTVAVLPFKNSGPREDEYLADGLTDDLIDVLSMTSGLKVRPRGAVAHLRGEDKDPQAVGAELSVQVIVEGSVRRTAAGVRVTARLLSCADGFQLWAKRFESAQGDVLGVNDEAANAIAEALTITGAPKPRVAPSDPMAIDLYLRASHESQTFGPEAGARAVALYEAALARAPHDPTILAGCARARARLAFFGGKGAQEMLALARESAERAVAGAPEIGEAWVALGSSRAMGGDAPGAVRALVTALRKSNGLATAHEHLGRILIEAGRVDTALFHLRTALSIDPSTIMVRMELARAAALLGNWAESDALMDLPCAKESDRVARYVFRSRLCLWRGETHPDLENPVALMGDMAAMLHPMGELIRTRALSDSYRETIERTAESGTPGSRRRTLFFQINADLFGYVFEIDLSLAAVREAVLAGLVDLLWMDKSPSLAAVRKDARFAPLRAEVFARASRILDALDET
jgi:serine/threonine-protein kinase